MAGRRRAFTLIELLVVVSIIALLVSILLPSLQKAREQAKVVVCSAQMRGLTQGLGNYTTDSNDWIPGMNTTGVRMRALPATPSLEALRKPDVPVQPHDWATPLLAQDFKGKMPNNRAERMRLVQERFRCPAQIGIHSEPFYTSKPADFADFENLKPWTGLSMLMPTHFQYWGSMYNGQKVGSVDVLISPQTWEAPSQKYVSMVSRVGNASEKVFVADGTRFLPESFALDHDVSAKPTHYGSFTSSGAWWAGSTTYGVRQGTQNWDGATVPVGSDARGANLSLSYRHRGGRSNRGTDCRSNRGAINAAFFDGHTQTLTDRASRNIRFWYPKGSIVNTASEGMTSVPMRSVVP
ncbi:MAG: prepilin-type N-terminal cleavage/methylation domain-containing protein [Phycisphaerae bacterium]|nr:prepilin-type N-terminal cleavage/methylation domain-containing protein [Phycisphaerae bacterium]